MAVQIHSHSHSHTHIHTAKTKLELKNPLTPTTPTASPPSLHWRGLDIDIDMSRDGLAFTFTSGIRAGVCVSSLLLPENEREADLRAFPKGHGHHRSSRDLHNLSATYPPVSCHTFSDCLQLPIPPLKKRFPTCTKSFRRPEIHIGVIYFQYYKQEIDHL